MPTTQSRIHLAKADAAFLLRGAVWADHFTAGRHLPWNVCPGTLRRQAGCFHASPHPLRQGTWRHRDEPALQAEERPIFPLEYPGKYLSRLGTWHKPRRATRRSTAACSALTRWERRARDSAWAPQPCRCTWMSTRCAACRRADWNAGAGPGPFQASPRGSLPMSWATASASCKRPSSRATTASVMGMSTPSNWARRATVRAL